jgi:N-acetylglucosaminyl-diphospho-decaprenol L-rhamnosyltransferase
VLDTLGSILSIDVVIPTFERWELTERCLQHLGRQTVTHTVTVVDNASRDGTPDKIRASFPDVRVIELEGNLGFPIACNRGASAGTGDVIVLLNNDVEVERDFLANIVRPLDDSRVGTVAALLVRPGRRTIGGMGLTADRTLAGFARLCGRPASEAGSSSPVLVGPSGAAGAYRRSAWSDVTGVDEGVRFYGEDVDLALRIRSAGWETAAAPDAVGVHLGSATAGRRSRRQRYESGFSRGYFLRRYRLLSTRAGPRALFTEGIVGVGDAVLNRDLSATRGRLAGWGAASGIPPRPVPPDGVLDGSIDLWASLRLRREAYFR